MDQLHEGHRQRLKERFLQEGLGAFQPHNALELLLFYALPQRDTNVLAIRLIQQFGSLSGVMDASFEDLIHVPGVGEHTAILIKLIPQMGKLYLNDKLDDGHIIVDADTAGEYLLPKFFGVTEEEVYLVCLDSKGKVLSCSLICEGTVNATQITVRLIVEQAVRVRAVSVVLAHNHPQGFALPSNDDIRSTLKIKDALDSIGIRLLDHIIVAQDDFVSLADSGVFL